MNTKTIVFIHGLFVNNISWAAWKSYFEKQGYTVHTPANPGHDGDPANLRTNIHPKLQQSSMDDVLDNLVKFIDTLPEKPIVIGHSFGGLMVMKLIEMGKAAAGVSIDGAPPKNVFPPLATLKAVLPVTNPFKGTSPFMGSREWYHAHFFNNYTRAESDKLYDQFAVPESRKVAWNTVLASSAAVDFKKPHNPILFIGGGNDTIFSAEFTKVIADRYQDKNSKVDYKRFEGRSHFIAGEKNWEEVAEYVLGWVGKY